MDFAEDDRGVSTLIGSLFVFGFIITGIVLNQVVIVPMQNQRVEFRHYESAQSDMIQLGSDIHSVAGNGQSVSSAVDLGVTYPARALAANPPPSAGRLEKRASGSIQISLNGGGSLAAAELCGGGASTYGISYSPDYNELTPSPINYENGQVYVNASSADVLLDNRTLINSKNRVIKIYKLSGSVPSKSRTSPVTVDFSGSETIGVSRGTDIDSITYPSELASSKWESEVIKDPKGEVASVYGSSGTVTVDFTSTAGTYTIECYTVGVGSTAPPTDFSTEYETTRGGGGGVGTGGISRYTDDDTSETISVPGGRWVGITCTDKLILSDAKPASKPNGNNLQGDVLRQTAYLVDDLGENYTIDTKIARSTDGSWNKKKVVIYDGKGNNVNAELTSTAASTLYSGGQTDILELSNYDDPDTGSGSFSDYVDRITRLEDDAPVTWQTSRMVGRVDVSLECDAPPAPPASGVVTLDGSTPNGEKSKLVFDLQVADGTEKEVTDIKVTTPGNQNSAVNSVDKLKRPSSPEVRLTPSNTAGVNQSGELSTGTVKTDGTEYSLDTNAIFADGAVLNANMGDLNGGNVKLTYNVADSESNADIIVTFKFKDGTKHEAYLRVTNVNS